MALNNTDSLINHKSKLKGDVNSVYHDGPVTISKDGKTMYFSRNDFLKNKLGKDKLGSTNLKIYKAILVDDAWTNIEEMPFNGSDFSNGHPALNPNETKLYFASDRMGGYGGSDIYYVEINQDGTYGKPKNIGAVVNTNKNEKFPFINSEGALFFASDGHPGLGLLDIFGTVSDKKNTIVSVINLGVPVNSSKDDFAFFMSADGLSGYFASNRTGGVGSDDIYAFDRVPQLIIEGIVTDAETNQPLPNTVVTLLNTNGDEIAREETDENGEYNMNIERDTDYTVSFTKNDFEKTTISVSSKNLERSVKSIKTDIVLNHKQKEHIQKTEFYPIYFDFNKAVIREDGTSELDRIVNLMVNKYPKMTIKISSHTDSRGTTEYNNELSQARAVATYNYLVNHGVKPERILEYKGYGEQQLVNNCDGTINCTEAQHQLNRRTDFIVITME
jgi:outer membrane protein OmpA-like peptidoglycan-associated protein